MDVATISGLATSLASAATMTKSLLGMKIDSDVRQAVIELQNSLISAQSAALSGLAERAELMQMVSELKLEMSNQDTWKKLKVEFYTESYPNGRFFYISKNTLYPGKYCPKCFENGRLARLQESMESRGGHSVECLQCETNLRLQSSTIPVRVDRGPGGWAS